MILQCDQCQTKFRLDDSKLKPGGVKVRCSKCRHVFLAGAEQKQEESEFDALLSGLGGPAPEKQVEPAPAKDAAAFFGFDEEPTAAVKAPEAVQKPEPAVSQPDLSDFDSFEFPAAAFAASAPAAEKAAQPAPVSQDLDFGDLAFSEEPAPVKAEQPERGAGLDFGELAFDAEGETKAGESPAAEGGAFDFGDFDFDASPAPPPERPRPTADALDFGEIAFNEEPALPQTPEAAQPAADDLDFGDISFNEEPPAASAPGRAQPAADEFDFGEFPLDQEPASTAAPEAAPSTTEGIDFGDFSFEEPTTASAPVKAPPADAFDFSEFSFDEEPAPAGKPEEAQTAADGFGDFSFEEPAVKGEEKPPSSAGIDALDFGDFTFSEEPAATKEEPAPAVKSDFEFDDFSFAEEPPPVAEEPANADDFGSFSFGEEPRQKTAEPVVPDAVPAAAVMPAEAADKADAGFVPGVAAAAGLFAAGHVARSEAAGPAPGAPPVSPAAAATPFGKESSLDFNFGDLPEEFDEDDLPPLGITSRRKGRSALTIAILVVSVLVVLALSAAGIYVMKSGPEALKKLDQFGIGFVADWFGVQTPDEGRITVRNSVAAFHQNKEAGELFVVSGEAVNSFSKPRAAVQVKVNIYDKSGAVLAQKIAYCGNRLTDEQLATLPMEKIDSIMNNQFGDSMANMGVKPGDAIGFVVAIANVPKEAADFGVEVVGSTVAAQ